jgi:potassium efflux system protein
LVGIWKTTIPALSALDRVTLWQEKSAVASGSQAAVATPVSLAKSTAKTSGGDAPAAAAPVIRVVTLQDLALAFVTVFLTIVAARNIPGLLELAVFRHLNLQPGSSFALTTSIRYVIVVLGIVLAFARIGIDWGKVQWIAAAITLGIGFGLQEIFANFVAGLIILFERPIRLGDVVTIAGIDGRVTQIRIRATTIRQFNSRELIVPNKEFITGQLVNWTLSDNILRFEIAIGIAYGSDTELARDLLLKAAAENPRVLDDPPPVALFSGIGGSTLDFMLRGHVDSLDDLMPAQSELYFAIDKSFADAGIEIAFPQTDIHIRSLPVQAAEAPATPDEPAAGAGGIPESPVRG